MSVLSDGVPFDQLRCPSCGNPFHRAVSLEEAEESFTTTFVPDFKAPLPPMYMTCWQGHAWSVKALTRQAGRADRVLLGELRGWLR